MERLTIGASLEIPRGISLIVGDRELEEQINKELSHKIGKEILELLNSNKGKKLIEKEVQLTARHYDVHRMEITLANRRDLVRLEMEKYRLEEENKKLKEKVKNYEAIGLKDVLDAMSKVETVTEFVNKLQELTEEYGEKVGN